MTKDNSPENIEDDQDQDEVEYVDRKIPEYHERFDFDPASMPDIDENFGCGYVGILGRPNVGKSTLMNTLIGQKIAITSNRPQTTRHRILGIYTKVTEEQQFQSIFYDTPGIHESTNYMNRMMNRAASSVLDEVDMYLFLIEARGWTDGDKRVLKKLANRNVPVILVINKIDMLRNKDELLPLILKSQQLYDFEEIVPLSAKNNRNTESLDNVLAKYLPKNPPVFPDDVVTDRSMRFMASELIREQLFRQLGQELPYVTSVTIESYINEPKLDRISAVIWVEKNSQKSIIIGKNGDRLKKIGSKSREQLEPLVGKKVFMDLWVKVKEGWAENEQILKSMGYSDE